MKISDLRKDVKLLSKPLLEGQGYVETGELGEHVKITEWGDKHAISFDEVRDKASFSVSLRVFIYYKEIEDVFQAVENRFPYTLNTLLSYGSVSIENYDIQNTKDILEKMISKDAKEFFMQYGCTSLISKNLCSSDYAAWVTEDKVTQIKVRIASAIFEKDNSALSEAIDSARKYTSQPWSLPDRDYINELCTKAQASI